ncbi:hypothetical protein ACFW1F_24340 [Streptomyces bungoensis]|uniref:hypothetical protein n=1 Tax=Streptomyces bungoensis TaxID=285568 RepID=UPI0034158714
MADVDMAIDEGGWIPGIVEASFDGVLLGWAERHLQLHASWLLVDTDFCLRGLNST